MTYNVNGINYNEKMITDLEELMILAHRINQYEEGCVFVSDRAHVEYVTFEISESKVNYMPLESPVEIRYGENRCWNDEQEIQDLKNKLNQLYEKLSKKSHSAGKQ